MRPAYLLSVGIGLILMALTTSAVALPRFAARTGYSCGVCHVNPTGAGPRTRFGANIYAPLALPMELGEVEIGAIPSLTFGNDFSASIGADLRLLYAYVEGLDPPERPALSSFFPMQTDLYITAELGEYVTVLLDRGMTNFEAFGMLHLPERKAWIKFGHFVMPYGLRLADHTTFVRRELGFSPRAVYYGLDTGIEVGARPGPFTFAVAVANGKPITGSAPVSFDMNHSKALYGRAGVRFGPAWLPLRVGVSGATNSSGRKVVAEEDGTRSLVRDDRIDRTQFGLYATAALGRLTYLGEADGIHTERFQTDEATLESSSEEVDGYVLFNELSFQIIQGLDLQLQFELNEPNIDDDLDPVRRLGAGFEAFPIPFFVTKFLYRHTLNGDREDIDEIAAIAHFYF
jgi:hypothetical protein